MELTTYNVLAIVVGAMVLCQFLVPLIMKIENFHLFLGGTAGIIGGLLLVMSGYTAPHLKNWHIIAGGMEWFVLLVIILNWMKIEWFNPLVIMPDWLKKYLKKSRRSPSH